MYQEEIEKLIENKIRPFVIILLVLCIINIILLYVGESEYKVKSKDNTFVLKAIDSVILQATPQNRITPEKQAYILKLIVNNQ